MGPTMAKNSAFSIVFWKCKAQIKGLLHQSVDSGSSELCIAAITKPIGCRMMEKWTQMWECKMTLLTNNITEQ